ncbi:MAG: hypothetical protein GY940_09235 [bacterium]|nr:hypothetical protein [bacterium]
MSNKVLEKKLLSSRLAITNAGVDEGIQGSLTRYSYTPVRLKVGLGHCETADRLYQVQLDLVAARDTALLNYRNLWEEAHKEYQVYRKVARLALRDNKALKVSLMLDKHSSRVFATWLKEARFFYTNALENPEVMKRLKRFGITAADLKAGKKMLDEAEDAAAFYELQKGLAMQATKERDDAFDILGEWMGDFWRICRIALADTPKQMVKLKMK